MYSNLRRFSQGSCAETTPRATLDCGVTSVFDVGSVNCAGLSLLISRGAILLIGLSTQLPLGSHNATVLIWPFFPCRTALIFSITYEFRGRSFSI
ncbi:hypothetical protein L596_021582 [Steinernema carpocapsae]|uniref:Uncharacterized protein n=1 Tax=Steinernema carpocapsae TaxID=34508 RepID=A0A4U5MJ72_STECR|nr:hypothetical protein L596_021582 [Steinernema carpocapsae]